MGPFNIVIYFAGFGVKKVENKTEVEVSFKFKLCFNESIKNWFSDLFVITLCSLCKMFSFLSALSI